MTTTDREVADHAAAGALADELPYWGWLPDDRTCLTRSGELVTLARLSPTVVDGHTPEQLDAVLNRWQRMLSGHRRAHPDVLLSATPAGDVPRRRHGLVGRRRPRATEAPRVPGEPHPTDRNIRCMVLRPETIHGRSRPAPRAVVEALHPHMDEGPPELPTRRIYFREQIEDATHALSATGRRQPYARRRPHAARHSHGPRRLACLAELVNKPGRAPWDGATGSGMELGGSPPVNSRPNVGTFDWTASPSFCTRSYPRPPEPRRILLHDLYRLDSVMTSRSNGDLGFWTRRVGKFAARSATTSQSGTR